MATNVCLNTSNFPTLKVVALLMCLQEKVKTFHPPPPPPPQDVQSIKICLINNLGEHVLGLVGAIRNICFPLFHMENVYIQYNSPIPILLPVSMNHLAERGQMLARVLGFLCSADKFSCRRFVNLLQTNLSAIDSQDIDGLHLKRAKWPRECHPFPFGGLLHFIIGKSINGDR